MKKYNLIKKLQKKGWQVINNQDNLSVKIIPVNKFCLWDFVSRDEEYVTGTEMLNRGKKCNALFSYKQALSLISNSQLIPKEWENYKIVFPGALWNSRFGELHCLYIYHDVKWHMSLYWLSYDFHHNCRFLVVN
ncbi:MAG: hypothetical protein IPK91_06275 [Saprospiraceae bacterium]|nr:hypothetical protein [Saprospiraceae bacterium]